MRLGLATAVMLAAVPAMAADDLPVGVEQNLTCGQVYSMHSNELTKAGDSGGATEFANMGDALLWRARTALEAAGYSAERIENVTLTSALVTGFSYGADPETALNDCLAAWDSP